MERLKPPGNAILSTRKKRAIFSSVFLGPFLSSFCPLISSFLYLFSHLSLFLSLSQPLFTSLPYLTCSFPCFLTCLFTRPRLLPFTSLLTCVNFLHLPVSASLYLHLSVPPHLHAPFPLLTCIPLPLSSPVYFPHTHTQRGTKKPLMEFLITFKPISRTHSLVLPVLACRGT